MKFLRPPPKFPHTAGRVTGSTPLRIWELPSATRLERQLAQAGAQRDGASAERVVILRADWVYDDPIVRGLVHGDRDVALCEPGGECVAASVAASGADAAAEAVAAGKPPAGAPRATAADIAGAYNVKLRKREAPYLARLTAAELPAIEKRIFGGAYKGVTDLVTLYLWPAPARVVTRWCARAGITPNQVTTVSLLLVFLTMWLFWHGHYLWGLAAAWPMTFLDTVDGKLARVTVASTRFGDVFDHGIDLLHPPFWWWAWIVGLPAAGLPLDVVQTDLLLRVVIAGYLLQRLQEGLFHRGLGVQMHVWRPFDSRFRLITARRNPNMVLLTPAALLGRPDIGIIAVAVWTVISILVHAVRMVQGSLARRAGPLQSWLSS